jgi:hypothetical protein
VIPYVFEVVRRERYYLIGMAFIGIAAALFEKQGAVDCAADRVWEEADAMTQRAARKDAEETKKDAEETKE